ncbi:MAG: hypothetical protein ACC641_04485 [Acidiferrobacterales bacterium]
MDLNLTVPEMDDQCMAVAETKPGKVELWLADLPLLNPAETGYKIFSALTALNRVPLDDKTRLKLLEIYREPVARLCTKLKDEYIGQPLPLTDNGRTAANRARELQIEMAYGYKQLVLNTMKTSRGRPGGRAMNSLALSIQRAIRYLSESLVKSYQFYAKAPENTWREIHQLCKLAEACDIIDNPVDDPLNSTLPRSSVSNVYKQALLVDFSDPYHLPVKLVGLIQHFLNRWAALAILAPAKPHPARNCQFLIDLRGDRAGELMFPSEVTFDEQHYRILNTVELARTIHSQLTMIQRGELPAPDGLHQDFFEGEYIQDMLKRLLNSWGVIPKRSFSRTDKSGSHIDVAIGIRAINHWLNGGRKFLLSSEFVGPMQEQRPGIGGKYISGVSGINGADTALDQNQTVEIDPELVYASWDIVDESAGGLAIAKDQVKHQQARVGDIIAVRSPDSGLWEVSGIRWVKTSEAGSLEIGMKRISPIATPVQLKMVGEDQIETDFMPAIMVPALAIIKQKQGLLTHKGLFRPGRELFFDDGFRLVKLRATQLVESTPVFEHFAYDEIS